MFIATLCAVLLSSSAQVADKTLLEELTRRGLPIPGGPAVKLPAPSMPDGLNKAKQKAVVGSFAENFPPGLFTARKPDALYQLKVRSLGERRENRRGHTIDLWFIAYAGLDQLTRDEALYELLGLQSKDEKGSRSLSEKELAARKIEAKKGERYTIFDVLLVDRVQLNGVLRSQKIPTKESLTWAAILDSRFTDDKEHPNRWRAVKQQPGEKPKVGPPHPYQGLGGYVKATELAEPAGALFIELHFVFHEPYEWFEGYNVLASKLPLAIRESVLKFRRKAAKKTR